MAVLKKNHLFWSDTAGNTRELDIEQEMRMASAAKTYLLEEIRYVYDETESALSGKKRADLLGIALKKKLRASE